MDLMPNLDDSADLRIVHALRLMREALAELDCVGATLAACRLQHAIDTLDPLNLIEPEE